MAEENGRTWHEIEKLRAWRHDHASEHTALNIRLTLIERAAREREEQSEHKFSVFQITLGIIAGLSAVAGVVLHFV